MAVATAPSIRFAGQLEDAPVLVVPQWQEVMPHVKIACEAYLDASGGFSPYDIAKAVSAFVEGVNIVPVNGAIAWLVKNGELPAVYNCRAARYERKGVA